MGMIGKMGFATLLILLAKLCGKMLRWLFMIWVSESDNGRLDLLVEFPPFEKNKLYNGARHDHGN